MHAYLWWIVYAEWLNSKRHLGSFPARTIIRFSATQIIDRLRTGFDAVQKLSLGFVEWTCAVVIMTTPRHLNGESIRTNYVVEPIFFKFAILQPRLSQLQSQQSFLVYPGKQSLGALFLRQFWNLYLKNLQNTIVLLHLYT